MTSQTIETVRALVDALEAVRRMCADHPALQAREYITLGIQTNQAVRDGRALLTQLQQEAAAVPQEPTGEAQPVAYMDAAKFRALQQQGKRGGILTTITPHRAFPEDVALYAAPVKVEAQPQVTEDDMHTLIGHAEHLKIKGQRDMPAYFYGLAERIARTLGDAPAAQRVQELAASRSPDAPRGEVDKP